MNKMISVTIVERLAELPWYTEGPAMDAQGNLFFTTLTGGIIFKMDTEGKLSHWAYAKCPNGQYIHPNGDHLICDSGQAGIARFGPDGERKGYAIKDTCDGQALRAPNDLTADAEGGMYFTDSVRESGMVCYFGTDGSQRIVGKGFDFPNGIALSADGKRLFVAESYRNRILTCALRGPGLPDGKWEEWARLPEHPSGDIVQNLPDGVRMGKDGLLYVAHYGMQAVQMLDEDGMLVDTVRTGYPLTSNLCLLEGEMIVTGGYGEPGPGGVSSIKL